MSLEMEVQAKQGLEPLKNKLREEIDKAVSERDKLGLSASYPVTATLSFANCEFGLATATPTELGPAIAINVLPFVEPYSRGIQWQQIQVIRSYLDSVRDFFFEDEDRALYAIEHPVLAIRELEQSLGERYLEKHKRFCDERGVSYKDMAKGVIAGSKPAREALHALLPELPFVFDQGDFSCVRHELDHVDLFMTNLYGTHLKNILQAGDYRQLTMLPVRRGNSQLRANCKEANLRELKTASQISPLLEARALFFDFVPEGQWTRERIEKATEDVRTAILEGYVKNTFAYVILDRLISNAWCDKEMDRETSNFLFSSFNGVRGSATASRYRVNGDGVNAILASRILGEFGAWQERFRASTHELVDAIGQAYRDDRSRLKAGNQARSYEQFLEIVRGQ